MTVDSLDAVFFTVSFLVPGFVSSVVISMLVPRRTQSLEIRALEFLTLSCVNYAIWSWAFFLSFSYWKPTSHPYLTALGVVLVVLVSPLMLGLAIGRSAQKRWVARILRRLGFRTLHHIPTAWDFHFSRQKPYWVTVTLRDGARIHGFFGLQSFAGDDPEYRDLFIEAVFRVLETGEWAPVEDSGGVLITAEQIALVEFRKIEGIEYGDE